MLSLAFAALISFAAAGMLGVSGLVASLFIPAWSKPGMSVLRFASAGMVAVLAEGLLLVVM